jgi:catechol 2,3-dioxygenase-like lactoylglutathione lyase family enzyme
MAMVTLFVKDMDESVRFYSSVLGMKVEQRYGPHFAELRAEDGMKLGLHPASAASPAGKMVLGFQAAVPLEETLETLRSQAVRIDGPIADDPPIRTFNFRDPNGAEMYFAELQR